MAPAAPYTHQEAAQRSPPASTSGRLPATRLGPTTAELLRDHNQIFQSLLQEYAYWVDDAWVTGTIPPELCGTYYRNGPGLQICNERYQRHTFDGDGMVLSLAFKDGKAFFRNKFVRTTGFVEEQAAGKPLHRNSFTRGSANGNPLFNPFDFKFKNVANTGVLCWGGQLFALWEAGLPHLMDPRSLDTLRETRMGGQLQGSAFAAHYRIVYEDAPAAAGQARQPGQRQQQQQQRRWVAFGTSVGMAGSNVTFYEFEESGRCAHMTEHPLKGVDITFVHDMVVTEHYYVLLMGPITFDAARFATEYVLGRCSIAECLKYDEAGKKSTKVMLFPRPGRPSGKRLEPRVLEAPPFFSFHHINAFEAQDGSVIIDTIAWDEVSFSVNQYTYNQDYYTGGSRTEYYRLTCDLAHNTVAAQRLLQRTVEFPAFDPRYTGKQHTTAWLLADMVDHPVLWGPAQAIVRVTSPHNGKPNAAGRVPVDTELWYCGARVFPAEPMFIPRPGSSAEGDGWLLVTAHNAGTGKAEVHILDAQAISKGPVATIHLPHHLPAGLHGSWEPHYMGPDPSDKTVPRWQLTNTIKAL